MASPYDPLVKIEGIQAINGPASVNATLLDGVTTANYEGIWIPWLFVKQGSLEVSGSMSTLSCQLYGTNAASPLNSYVVTIGGSVATNDVETLTVTTPGGPVVATYTALVSDTTTLVAAGLVAFINTSTAFNNLGIKASNVNAVLTLTWPSVTPAQGMGQFYSTGQPVIAPFFTVVGSSTGSATFAVTAAATGSTVGSAITTLGMTQFTISARWLKLRITTLTGGGATITAIAQGTA